MNNDTILKIRDGVDIYLIGDNILTIYFMNTRKQIKFEANQLSVQLLESIDGKKTISEIRKHLEILNFKQIHPDSFIGLLNKLLQKGILIVQNDNNYKSYLTDYEIDRFDRQLNFFGDFLPGTEEKFITQKKLADTTILLFGCGSIGGWIATQLAMVGFKKFILVDGDKVEETDVTRHVYYTEDFIGMYKVEALKIHLSRILTDVVAETIPDFLTPQSSISHLIDKADFVINTADEPYIGYTSLKISRACVQQKKAHFIAGGFDAHLASTGELIIPGVTACVDCYADHFKEVLSDWTPSPHPVLERHLEIGGLPGMTLWSASFAVIEIVKFLGNLVSSNDSYKSRGEFSFDFMKIDYLDVKRNPECRTCGGVKNAP